jgi:hypothetical protein
VAIGRLPTRIVNLTMIDSCCQASFATIRPRPVALERAWRGVGRESEPALARGAVRWLDELPNNLISFGYA